MNIKFVCTIGNNFRARNLRRSSPDLDNLSHKACTILSLLDYQKYSDLLSSASESYELRYQFDYETHSSYCADTKEHKAQMCSIVFFASLFC
jgi:hypothetical protein